MENENNSRYYVARYRDGTTEKAILFDRGYPKERAEEYLEREGIQNFFFFFEPAEPIKIKEGEYLFKGEVGFDITVERLLPHMQAGDTIVLDTPGGALYEAYAIYDVYKKIDCQSRIEGLHMVASAGTVILLSAPKERRALTDNCKFLIHEPWNVAVGAYSDLQREADELKEERDKLARFYETNANITFAEAVEDMAKDQFWSASKAAEKGFVAKATKDKKDFKTNISNMAKGKKDGENKKGLLNALSTLIAHLGDDEDTKSLILQDTEGVELDFGEEVETPEQITVGSTAEIEGEPAEGVHTLGDGRTLTFDNGEVVKVSEAGDSGEAGDSEEVEALKAEVSAQKTEIEDLKAKLSEAKTEVQEAKTAVQEAKAKAKAKDAEVKAAIDKVNSYLGKKDGAKKKEESADEEDTVRADGTKRRFNLKKVRENG